MINKKYISTETNEVITTSDLLELFNSAENEDERENGTSFKSYIYDLLQCSLIKEL